MKVLHVVPAVAPRYGGPSAAALAMHRALSARGIDAVVATTDADGPGNRLPVATGCETSYEGARVVFFPREWSEAFKLSRPLARWLADNVARFDVVQIEGIFSHCTVAAARACRRAGIPYVVRPLGQLSRWSLSRKPFRKLAFWGLAGRRAVKGASAVFFTSEAERRQAASALSRRRGVVISLAVGEEYFGSSDGGAYFRSRHPELNDLPYVLTLGRLLPTKGIGVTIEAFASSRDRTARLVIAGSGDPVYERRLRERVARLGIENRLVFPGWLTGDEKRSALAGAALFVLPSLHENFGIAVAEAMACGVPVIVTGGVALSEDVERAGAGWVVDGGVEGVAAAISAALSAPEERQSMGAKGRRYASDRFRWARVASDVARLYEMLPGRSAAA